MFVSMYVLLLVCCTAPRQWSQNWNATSYFMREFMAPLTASFLSRSLLASSRLDLVQKRSPLVCIAGGI